MYKFNACTLQGTRNQHSTLTNAAVMVNNQNTAW